MLGTLLAGLLSGGSCSGGRWGDTGVTLAQLRVCDAELGVALAQLPQHRMEHVVAVRDLMVLSSNASLKLLRLALHTEVLLYFKCVSGPGVRYTTTI